MSNKSLSEVVKEFLPVETSKDIQKIFDENSIKKICHEHKDLNPMYIIDFLSKAMLTGADPRQNEIYLVSRWDGRKGEKVGTVIYSYHFLLSQAENHPDFEGVEVESKVEEIFDPASGQNKKQLVSTATVYRGGKPMVGKARWGEYFVEKNPVWKSKPYAMLEKCAISVAIRRAFPKRIANMVTMEEMEREVSDGTIEDNLAQSSASINDEIKSEMNPEDIEIGSPKYIMPKGPADIRNKRLEEIPIERLTEYYDKLDAKNSKEGLSEDYAEMLASMFTFLESLNL